MVLWHSATVSPVPACHAFFAVLAWPSVPARPPIRPTLPRAVQAWTGGEEPYTVQPGPPVPARPPIGLPSPVPTCPALLPARSSFLAVPAWVHGEEPYSCPILARHARFPCLYLRPGNTSQTADHINRQLVKQQRRYLFKA